jgi:hypothetical protein
VEPQVQFIRLNTGCQPVWPAEPLQPGWDLTVIQAGIVAALAADNLVRLVCLCVATFRLAGYDAGRLAAQHRNAAKVRLTRSRRHAFPLATPR